MDDWQQSIGFYWDPDGMPISLGRWIAMFEELRESGEFQVALTEVGLPGGGTARVSTVWIGLDAACGYEGHPPLIYETMVFFVSGDYGSEGYQEKTPTREAALAAHDQALEWTKTLGVEREESNDARHRDP